MPARDELLDEVPEVVTSAWVEAGGGFVQEEDRRAGDKAGTDVEPPAHPAGVGLDQAGRRPR